MSIRPTCPIGNGVSTSFNFNYSKRPNRLSLILHKAVCLQNRPHSTLRKRVQQKHDLGSIMPNKFSRAYKALCTEYYELDKPQLPPDALACYLAYADEAKGPILEPMCGTGRFLIPLAKRGFSITGFDYSHHMLDVCREKCQKEGVKPTLIKASFDEFSSDQTYPLIFIPSGSFSLLTQPIQITQALNTMMRHLAPRGKFVFEVDTLKSLNASLEVWKGNCIDKPDGSQLVLSTFSMFDKVSRINTILCRYELWQKNRISETEVENFRVRLYKINEVEEILERHGGLKITNKLVPYTKNRPTDEAESILYECVKI